MAPPENSNQKTREGGQSVIGNAAAGAVQKETATKQQHEINALKDRLTSREEELAMREDHLATRDEEYIALQTKFAELQAQLQANSQASVTEQQLPPPSSPPPSIYFYSVCLFSTLTFTIIV